jgi:serine protease Do
MRRGFAGLRGLELVEHGEIAMKATARLIGGTAGALALLMAGLAVPAGAQTAPAQAQQAPAVELPPGETAPPEILPAPPPPGDPLVELPPEGAPPPAVAAPGIPLTQGGAPFSFADLAAELLDSVIYISTSQRVTVARDTPMPDMPQPPPGGDMFDDFFDNDERGEQPRMVQSLGSGFVIDPSGLIVTNNHVIADADEIVANFRDGSKLTAKVVGVDDKTDLALLQVESPTPLKAARFGRSEQLRVGDWVLAIGNPFGFGGTVTAGIVSALDRDINSGPYDHYIQTDASINRGNSGGPLFNLGGEVVGINTAIMSPTGGSIGIGFAVPSEIAVPVIEQLRQFGEVRRGWIGVRIQEVTDEFAEGLGMQRATGALIAGLTAKGPAEKAGLQSGDVVVEFNGKPVDSMRALPRMVADTAPGKVADLVVMRDGKRLTLKVEIGLLGEEQVAAAEPTPDGQGTDAPADQAPSLFGLTLGPITDAARSTYSIAGDLEGVLVTAVAPGSEAAEKSVKPGDVIVQVSQKPVTAPEEVSEQVEQSKSQGRRTVMFLVSGADQKLRFLSLRFDPQ